MTYALSFIENDQYLHILFSGDFVSGDVKALWTEIYEHLGTNQTQKRILVEEQPGTTGQLDMLEVFETASFLANSHFAFKVKIAVLYLEEVSLDTLNQARFGETVAVNRGANMKVFASKEEAETWLFA